MKNLPINSKRQIGGCYSKKSIFALKKSKAFTLIELLVVIAIIGILAGVVIASLNSARTSGRVAAIKSNLKNLQNQAQLYHLDNGTFAGLCTYNPTGVTAHASIQPMIDALISIAGADKVRCVVRTSDVPRDTVNNFIPADSLETKNFGVAVYFNERHYAVDAQSVITLDSSNSGTSGWIGANNICATAGKRLPPVEVLKSIYDYNGNVGFNNNYYWSSTPSIAIISSNNVAYVQGFNDSYVLTGFLTTNYPVRCAS